MDPMSTSQQTALHKQRREASPVLGCEHVVNEVERKGRNNHVEIGQMAIFLTSHLLRENLCTCRRD